MAPSLRHPLPLLGLDPGDRRLGIALADETGALAHALETFTRGKGRDEFARLARLLKLHGARGFVVGLPLLPSGGEGEQAAKARAFVRDLARRFPLHHIALVDERLSTFAAEDELRDAGVDPARGPGLDAHAARHVLDAYLREGPLEVVQSGAAVKPEPPGPPRRPG